MWLGVPELGQGTSETWGCSGGARVADNKGELLGKHAGQGCLGYVLEFGLK